MPGNLFMLQERERVMLDLLRKHGRLPLTEQKILEVGCAEGKTLLSFLRYGARPENLIGVDLIEHNIAEARKIAPNVRFEVADGRDLQLGDGSVDLVVTFAVFSSIQSQSVRRSLADEIKRVLHSSGAVLVYDFSITSPVNRDNRPVSRKEIRELFPDYEVDARRVTLAPPLARRLAPRSWLMCELLVKVPLLRTHFIALITKRITR